MEQSVLDAERGHHNSQLGRVFGNLNANFDATDWLKIDVRAGRRLLHRRAARRRSAGLRGNRRRELRSRHGGQDRQLRAQSESHGNGVAHVQPELRGTFTLGNTLDDRNYRQLPMSAVRSWRRSRSTSIEHGHARSDARFRSRRSGTSASSDRQRPICTTSSTSPRRFATTAPRRTTGITCAPGSRRRARRGRSRRRFRSREYPSASFARRMARRGRSRCPISRRRRYSSARVRDDLAGRRTHADVRRIRRSRVQRHEGDTDRWFPSARASSKAGPISDSSRTARTSASRTITRSRAT